ncbi:MAG: hypothetical protein HY428_01925 [Candidatus Levybacteria bacterium]|nr:hypothetical protein [Candidatus Levybacteria bacterium]
MQKKFIFILLSFLILIPILLFAITITLRQKPPQRPSPTPFPTFSPGQKKQAEETKGEAGFTPEDARQFIEARKRSDDAYTERRKRLPFIVFLPYQTSHFKVEIMSTSDTVTVTTFASTQQNHLRYQEEAKNWLTANGANFQFFTLRYIPESP